MISHLFGFLTRKLTCTSSPDGRKGRCLGRENRDKGWVERGRCQGSSWDGGCTVTESERTRPKDRRRLMWLLVADLPAVEHDLFFSKFVPMRHSWSKFTPDESLPFFGKQPKCHSAGLRGRGMRRKGQKGKDAEIDWRTELAEGQKCDLNGEVWGNKESILIKWNTQCCTVSNSLTLYLYLSSYLPSLHSSIVSSPIFPGFVKRYKTTNVYIDYLSAVHPRQRTYRCIS